MEKKETAAEKEKRERRERYLEELARRQKVNKAVKKLRAMPRFILVRKVEAKWKRLRKSFNHTPSCPSALSNITLRALLVTGQPPCPAYVEV